MVCIPTVGALKHAQKAVEMGADLITVQGGEGGGHTGCVPTSMLLPQVLDAVSVPVVAAGGFNDGRGLASALASGAAGIAMGTRFLMCAEARCRTRPWRVTWRSRTRRRSSSAAPSTACRNA